ncbi:hypothetical protein PsYK624_101320 [Phanerochaete sordida]|uniref:Nephrocystin 3-like N-terminal domain-containing protein n=1 Tax=Phanerochaete sordida TaxID=48140 RepID=A0A9P3GFK5_9APHY|nr:hypothetical protein PsYK624_101320 [Phanerochaete sordida]
MLQERLDRLSSALGNIRETSTGLKGGPGLFGSFKRFLLVERNKATLAKMNEELADALTMFSVGTQGATENAVCRVEDLVMNSEEEKIIEAVPHSDAGYLSVKETKSGFMQGTRNETFANLEAWACAGFPVEDPRRIFLVTACAGLGKSAIAHQLCIRLAEDWGLNLGASFFFSRGAVDSAHVLFSTIAYQLSLSQPMLRPFIIDAARGFLPGGKEQQVRRTFEQLLLKPLAKSASDGAVFNEITFIVIDGVDECKDRKLVPDILRCLLELVHALPWLRVFIATRPEPYILPVLTSQAAQDIIYHRRLDGAQATDESKNSVELYLRQTIPKIHPYGAFIREHPDQLDRLVSRAGGLFIYARMVINYLEMYDTRPEEQIARLCSSSGAGLLPLDELYLLILRFAFPPRDLQRSPDMHKRLHDFLTFIALHHISLPFAAISLLLKLTEDDVLWMAGRLRAVLLVDMDGDLVPLHATFAEFLVDSKRCVDPLYHVNPPKGHALLACKCLDAFNHDTATLYLKSYPNRHEGGHPSIEYNIMSSWQVYISNWGKYLNSAERNDEVQQELRRVLKMQPVMTRLYGTGVKAEFKHIRHFFQDAKEAAAVCNDHLNFRFYCELWWQKMAENCGTSRAVSVTIADLENSWESYITKRNMAGIVNLNHSIQVEDITRYTAILQELVDKIRDSGTEELWYNLGVGSRRWYTT